jgi:FkbM family methyltransferase
VPRRPQAPSARAEATPATGAQANGADPELEKSVALQLAQVGQDPDDPQGHHRLASLLAGVRRFEDAARAEQQALALAPDEWRYARPLSRYLELAGDTGAAQSAAERADALEQRDFERFIDAEKTEKEKLHTQLRAVIEACEELPQFIRLPGVDRAERLLDEQFLDSVVGWYDFLPQLFGEGEVAAVPGIGRFNIHEARFMVSKRLARGMTWELPVGALLAELAARCDPRLLMVDIGANIGVHTVCLAREHRGRVLAFEPDPDSYESLVANLELNRCSNVEAVQKACSAHSGRAKMVQGSQPDPAMRRVEPSDEGDIGLTTIDAEVHRLGRPVALLRIDAEGHEAAVLDGARRVLERQTPVILCEHVDRDRPIAPLLERVGYRQSRFFRHDWLFLPEAPQPKAE